MHIKRIFTASSRDQISLCKIQLIPLFNGHAVLIMNNNTKIDALDVYRPNINTWKRQKNCPP